MKCENCGTEFDRGNFCPNCGTKCNEEAARIKNDTKAIYNKRYTKDEKGTKQMENDEKMPWCFSGWFIIIISILTFWIFWIPGIILAIIRLLKYREKRKSSLVLTLLLGIPCGALIVFMVSEIASASEIEKQLNAYIENGQYAEAQELIDREYGVGSSLYVEKMADLYELQEMYDEAANLWLEYCINEYELIDIPDYRINKINGYVEKYGAELQPQTVSKIQNMIKDRELAKTEEQAAKEAKEAEEKAAKEAKEAEEKAAKEAKEAEKKAAKEAKEAEEKVAKEAKESEDDTTADGNNVIENRNNTDIDAVLPDDPDYEKYIHVGYTYKLKNGGTMEILDAGYGYGTVYVLVEFTSGSDEGLFLDQSDAVLYIDDYEVPVGVPEQLAIENGYISIAPGAAYPTEARVNPGGRKATIVFVSCVPDNISETSEVEFDITGGIFKINPLTTGQAKKNTEEQILGINSSTSTVEPSDSIQDDNESESSIVYGMYSLSHNSVGGHNEAEVGFYTDEDGGDYVYIKVYDKNGELMNDYNGYSPESGNPCVFKNKYDTSYRITFINGGINVETVTGTADDYDKEFIGFYQLNEALNLDRVG